MENNLLDIVRSSLEGIAQTTKTAMTEAQEVMAMQSDLIERQTKVITFYRHDLFNDELIERLAFHLYASRIVPSEITKSNWQNESEHYKNFYKGQVKMLLKLIGQIEGEYGSR